MHFRGVSQDLFCFPRHLVLTSVFCFGDNWFFKAKSKEAPHCGCPRGMLTRPLGFAPPSALVLGARNDLDKSPRRTANQRVPM